jgi:Tfp pilus assembly protein PilN
MGNKHDRPIVGPEVPPLPYYVTNQLYHTIAATFPKGCDDDMEVRRAQACRFRIVPQSEAETRVIICCYRHLDAVIAYAQNKLRQDTIKAEQAERIQMQNRIKSQAKEIETLTKIVAELAAEKDKKELSELVITRIHQPDGVVTNLVDYVPPSLDGTPAPIE